MNSDKGKLYIKIVELIAVYNSIVDLHVIRNCLDSKNFVSNYHVLKFKICNFQKKISDVDTKFMQHSCSSACALQLCH
jgi:hypothetical protein